MKLKSILPCLSFIVAAGNLTLAAESRTNASMRIEAIVDAVGVADPFVPTRSGTAVVFAAPLAGCGEREWSVLWPAIAARAGVVMDRRGIERAAQWAPRASAGQMIPLAGEATIARTATTFVVKGTPGASHGYIFHQ